jgi:hypothetical protein
MLPVACVLSFRVRLQRGCRSVFACSVLSLRVLL